MFLLCLSSPDWVNRTLISFKPKLTKIYFIITLSFFAYFQEKYEEENENSSEKTNNNNNETTILTTTGTQPQQIFHVSVEYEEPKPKLKTEMSQNSRKRRLITKDGIEISQQQLLNQYVNQMQPSSSTPKQTPTIIIDDKSQDHEIKSMNNDVDESAAKSARSDETKKLDKFEVFGMFVANEMKSLQNASLQRKLKRKILECILEMNDQDDQDHA
jgi:hypothetical protein